MAGEGGHDNPELSSLAGSSVLIRDILNCREELCSITIKDVLAEHLGVEDLEKLADQYLGIAAQF